MISAPKDIYGINVFKIVLHEVTLKRAAKILDVTERTIWRWLSQGHVPKAAVLALYWESSYGRSLINTDHHAEIVLLRQRIQLLEEQFVRAKDVITGMKLLNYGTSNEPYFDERGEFNVRNPTTGLSDHVPNGDEYSSIADANTKSQSDVSGRMQAGKDAEYQTLKVAV